MAHIDILEAKLLIPAINNGEYEYRRVLESLLFNEAL